MTIRGGIPSSSAAPTNKKIKNGFVLALAMYSGWQILSIFGVSEFSLEQKGKQNASDFPFRKRFGVFTHCTTYPLTKTPAKYFFGGPFSPSIIAF